jgi:VanZ family protein
METDERLLPTTRRWIFAALVGATAAYWLAIFVATHWPPRGATGPPAYNDKLAHFVAYGGLAGGLMLAAIWLGKRNWRVMLLVFSAAALYGVFDECTQTLVGRTPDVKDWLADIAGAGVGILAAMGITKLCTRN